jgi:hypothetical protein
MSNFVKLTADVLNVGDVVDVASDASTGAIAMFVGTTRNHFNGKKVVSLVSSILFRKFGRSANIFFIISDYDGPKWETVILLFTPPPEKAYLDQLTFYIFFSF